MPRTIRDLLPALLASVRNSKIQWKATEARDVFWAEFTNYHVGISAIGDGFKLIIFKKSGGIVDELVVDEFDRAFASLYDLYHEAKNKALGIDVAIADILHDLNK